MDLSSKVLNLCQQNLKGVSEEVMQLTFADTPKADRVSAINSLLSDNKIALLQSGKQLIYKVKTNFPESVEQQLSDQQEKIVYEIIAGAGNKGVWIRDIRLKSNLIQSHLNKILKNLENKKLVKSIKSVAASKKKVYMLYELTPDQSVSGGAWYSDQDFESEFVDVLSQQCAHYLEQKAQRAASQKNLSVLAQKTASYVSSEEVCRYISELGISKIFLTASDIQTILDTLVYDGRADFDVSPNSEKLYCFTKPLLPSGSGLVRNPCGTCPVFKDCHSGGIVSPETCTYMKEWLDS